MAEALNLIQSTLNEEEKHPPIEVLAIEKMFGKGTDDEDWIPPIGQEKGIVITQDRVIQRSKAQRELYMKSGVGIFFLKAPKTGMNSWDMFTKLIKWWPDMKKIARKNPTPFAYRQPGQNVPFEEWKSND